MYVIIALNTLSFLLLMRIWFSTRLVSRIRQDHLLLKYNWTFYKKNSNTALSKNFYRLYKYMYIQSTSGSRAEDMLKSLHLVITSKSLKKTLLHMSAMIAHNNDVSKAIQFLKKEFKHDDGAILVGIMESLAISGLSKDAFVRLDHMLFQKYLSQLRQDTKNIGKLYFYAVVCFVVSASGVIFLPLIDQMFKSANIIFK